ncbi:unnamed protein product, partial [Amoebophrya sp. A120]|eukprot:GSA120T00020320001.1
MFRTVRKAALNQSSTFGRRFLAASNGDLGLLDFCTWGLDEDEKEPRLRILRDDSISISQTNSYRGIRLASQLARNNIEIKWISTDTTTDFSKFTTIVQADGSFAPIDAEMLSDYVAGESARIFSAAKFIE